jgi:hypothetical protein
METMSEGTFPYFHEAFTQLHLDLTLAFCKCYDGDRRDGRINPNADHISRNFGSVRPRVGEDLGIAALGRHASYPLGAGLI